MRAEEERREEMQKEEINREIERNASKLETVDGGEKSRETEGEKFTWRWRKGSDPSERDGRNFQKLQSGVYLDSFSLSLSL